MSSEAAFPRAAVQRAIDHMNEDHRDSLLAMARTLAGLTWADDAELLALDPAGIDLRASAAGRTQDARIDFPTPLDSARQLRAAMIDLARRAGGTAEHGAR